MAQLTVDVGSDLGAVCARGIVVDGLDVQVAVGDKLRVGLDGVVAVGAVGSPLFQAVGVPYVALPDEYISCGIEAVVV